MENINFILCIIYLLLAVLNIIGVITITDSAIFGMTVGALFLCIAPLFNKKIFRILFYIMAAGFIVGFQLINEANKIVKNIDNNTWLLLSLSVTFLSNFLSTIKSRKFQLKSKSSEIKKRKDDIQTLKNEINKYKN
ncbi:MULTISPECIES: hypothetical protein [Clostridium]|uniref:hypothetical protein n=1 Tax=Clostridium TaxID=1485 RepID=UPI000826E3EB|nr:MULTISPECIES: hypothetical protein [Clostridium]PJI08666.1 hypothetical protein CUB90_12675 [Clostridium sp. CT7]